MNKQLESTEGPIAPGDATGRQDEESSDTGVRKPKEPVPEYDRPAQMLEDDIPLRGSVPGDPPGQDITV